MLSNNVVLPIEASDQKLLCVSVRGAITNSVFSHLIWMTCWYILIPLPPKLTQNASLKLSVAAHIHFKTLLLADKVTQTYEEAARPDLTLHHSLCPVSAVLLLMAKWTGHCYAQTGLLFLPAHWRWNDLPTAVTYNSLLQHENPSLQGQGAPHLLLNLTFLLIHAWPV